MDLGEVFASAVSAVLTLFVFMAGGFVFAKMGLVKPDFSRQVSGVVFKFFFPLMLLKIILLQTELKTLAEGMVSADYQRGADIAGRAAGEAVLQND